MEQYQHVKSWYGVTAEIAVENNLWHLVRVGGVALHHPPLVNLLLRRGMPRQERLHLSFLHEFGHLQTLPVPILHLLWLWKYGRFRKRNIWGVITWLFAAGVAHQAVWELASEAYVVMKVRGEYGRIYRRFPNSAGQSVFWGSMLTLTLLLSRWMAGQTK